MLLWILCLFKCFSLMFCQQANTTTSPGESCKTQGRFSVSRTQTSITCHGLLSYHSVHWYVTVPRGSDSQTLIGACGECLTCDRVCVVDHGWRSRYNITRTSESTTLYFLGSTVDSYDADFTCVDPRSNSWAKCSAGVVEDDTCPSDTWRCGSNMCLPLHWLCDGETDCTDGSDETNCDHTCPPNTWRCTDPASNRCLALAWRCDGDEDCSDGSDEKNCGMKEIEYHTCPPNTWRCSGPAHNQCLPLAWRCDGENDCSDGSDEKNCGVKEIEFPSTPTPAITSGDGEDYQSTDDHTCPPNTWRCSDPAHNQCLHLAWRCDGDEDCSDGSDENNCGVKEIEFPTTPTPAITSQDGEDYQSTDGEPRSPSTPTPAITSGGGEDYQSTDGISTTVLHSVPGIKLFPPHSSTPATEVETPTAWVIVGVVCGVLVVVVVVVIIITVRKCKDSSYEKPRRQWQYDDQHTYMGLQPAANSDAGAGESASPSEVTDKSTRNTYDVIQ